METVREDCTFLNDFKMARVDERIKYPSYKVFDEFIDLKALCSLDGFLIERLQQHIKAEKNSFFLTLHRLEETSPYQPGAREIWLSRTKQNVTYNYLNLDQSDLWEQTEAAEEFKPLMDFIRTLPFQATGRILIIYDPAGQTVPAHRDHLCSEICHEFIWLRTNLVKPFYMLNQATGEKKYVKGYSAWFDTVNQYHGSDACDGLSFSIRVDGKFTDKFREKIPKPKINPASTPSFWACFV